MSKADVTILQSRRCSSIKYLEGGNTIPFEWGFGGSVAAIVRGPNAQDWDGHYPSAKGHRAEIYEFVTGELIRQKAPSSRFEIDLALGEIMIV